ncbi:MAG: hypothetical protein IJ627_02395 [Bacteroidales bacterium]|nr:hypothetical protein [Bacteroidales bacterium]MBR6886107.1 hypothetical protein [Bacteroidales bacterium]
MSKFFSAIGNTLRALRRGEFLLRIRADKYYLHIAYLFVITWISILLGLRVDKTLAQSAENRITIEQLRIRHSEKQAELVKLQSASATEIRLKKMGSKAAMPQEPPTILK